MDKKERFTKALEILSSRKLSVDFAQYFYDMKATFPGIERKEILHYFNKWRCSQNLRELKQMTVTVPKTWLLRNEAGMMRIQIPA